MISGIVFDMDGVLIDARDWHRDALNDALRMFGFNIGEDEHLEHYDGLPTRVKLERMSSVAGLPRGLHPVISALKQEFTAQHVVARCRPQFIHEYMLNQFRREGFRLACASNSVRASVELMLGRANLLHYFDAVLSNEDVREAKPAPDIYLAATEALGLEAGSCLAVEDNPNGVAAAEAAGLRVLMVNNPAEVTYLTVRKAISGVRE